MSSDHHIHFGPFLLDLLNARVMREAQELSLTPKAFAVLLYLIERQGRLVTKSELLAGVWPETVVSEGILKVSILELRKALGDKAKTPQFIETVHSRGYRFLAPTSASPPPVVSSQHPVGSRQVEVVNSQYSVASRATESRRQEAEGSQENQSLRSALSSPTPNTQHATPSLVGRDAELTVLQAMLAKALNGERQLVFVTGEAGIGKTALVDAFLERLEARDWSRVPIPQASSLKPPVSTCWIGRGQCVEHYGVGEAYLPVLEVLSRLCRGAAGERLVPILRQYAPMWLLQLPWLLSADERQSLSGELVGATRERMLRELVDTLDVVTAETPLVLVLEDLHWSDYSTVDLLTALARRQAAARLLVIGTYRPVDVIVSGHPVKALTQELLVRRLCQELPLELLPQSAVETYLARVFPTEAADAASFLRLASLLHQRTSGNPLFLVNVVKDLTGQAGTEERLIEVAQSVPEGIRQMIERQSERLTTDEQRVLEGASVAGVDFTTAIVAAALEAEVEQVEVYCERLVQRKQFLSPQGIAERPDGTVAGRYVFSHALYQQVFYDRVSNLQRRRMHHRIGEQEESAYGERARDRAAELAMHFERGEDIPKAVQYRRLAGENALRQYGYHEAIEHITRGLELLGAVPETSERIQQELLFQLTLGSALTATRSYVAIETGQAYRRAVDLCDRLSDTLTLFPALNGLWRFHLLRAELPAARALSEQLLQRAQRMSDPALLLESYRTLGSTVYWCGEFLTARAHLEQCMALYESRLHHAHVFSYGLDPGVMSLTVLAQVLWVLGYPEQARQRGEEALALAHEIAHPVSLMHCLTFVEAMVRQHRREPQETCEHAEAHIAFAAKHGFVQWGWMNTFLRGWALAEMGRVEDGITQMRQGMDGWRSIGADLHRPYFLALLAEAHGNAGKISEGLTLLDEALDVVRYNGEALNEAELWRLKGELLLQRRNREAE
jgi:DNA-binding winged helix-turn-helix (wHTH) protein/predicted ATPase